VTQAKNKKSGKKAEDKGKSGAGGGNRTHTRVAKDWIFRTERIWRQQNSNKFGFI